jgi:hypothetical protein
MTLLKWALICLLISLVAGALGCSPKSVTPDLVLIPVSGSYRLETKRRYEPKSRHALNQFVLGLVVQRART